MKVRGFTPTQNRELARLIKLGYKTHEMATIFDRHPSSIKKILERRGYEYINKKWIKGKK